MKIISIVFVCTFYIYNLISYIDSMEVPDINKKGPMYKNITIRIIEKPTECSYNADIYVKMSNMKVILIGCSNIPINSIIDVHTKVNEAYMKNDTVIYKLDLIAWDYFYNRKSS